MSRCCSCCLGGRNEELHNDQVEKQKFNIKIIFTFLASLVCVSSEPVVELLLVAIKTGVRSGQTVHLPSQTVLEREDRFVVWKESSDLTYLHVSLIVEVGHVPAVLLVIIVVGVGAVVAGRDALSVRGRGSVVEVGSAAVGHLCPGAQANLLLLLGPGGSDTDHPDEEDQ